MKAQAIALLLALVSVGCGASEEPSSQPPAPPVTPSEPEPTPEPEPPREARPVDPEEGRAHYALYCATCHGATGRGDGLVAASLDPKPANHADAAYMGALSDEHIFRVIKEGGPAVGKSPLMAAWGGTLSDEQIRDLVAFIRTLPDA